MNNKSDVRNVININNNFGCDRIAIVFSQEEENNSILPIPDKVRVNPGDDEPTGDMRIPWCDSQKELDAGHYIELTFHKKNENDIVMYMFQSKDYIYTIEDVKLFEKKKVIAGDSSLGKGEYKLEIHMNNDGVISLSIVKYQCDIYNN